MAQAKKVVAGAELSRVPERGKYFASYESDSDIDEKQSEGSFKSLKTGVRSCGCYIFPVLFSRNYRENRRETKVQLTTCLLSFFLISQTL